MTWLVLGVALWWATHSFKRWLPELRAELGDKAKALVAVGVLVSVVVMVIGYRAAEATELWYFPWAVHLNNLLMVVAVVLFGLGNSKSRLRGKLRHPAQTGLIVWAVAHLLVNGDLPSLILFGGLGLWSAMAMVMINRAEPAPEPFSEGTVQGDIRLAVISVVIFAVIVALHIWLGPSPFPG